MINYSGKLQQLLCLITCVLMVVAVSIRRDGKVAGRELKQQQKASPKTETMVVLEDGSVRLNTTELVRTSLATEVLCLWKSPCRTAG